MNLQLSQVKAYVKSKLLHATRRNAELCSHHEGLGGESKLTYHGGFDAGYLKGRLSVLEDLEDILNTPPNVPNNAANDESAAELERLEMSRFDDIGCHHEFDDVILLSYPPKRRCIKCKRLYTV